MENGKQKWEEININYEKTNVGGRRFLAFGSFLVPLSIT
jgi:hypothetical protein